MNNIKIKLKTSELTEEALDRMVAKCEVGDAITEIDDPHFYSTDWAQGGPIIERQRISTQTTEDYWDADLTTESGAFIQSIGDTPLVAAMRAYVASKLGDEIKVPDELLQS